MSRASRAAALLCLCAAAWMPAAITAQQQAGSINGTVTNRQGGAPLAGAQVFLQNTRHGTISDPNGRFVIPNVPAGNYTIVAQFIGYGEVRQPNVRVTAGQTTTVPLTLETAALAIQQLVVTGVQDPTAGVKVPFTVAKVTAEQLQVPSAGGALATLSGKVAGASVMRTSGRPGQGVAIQLRTPTASEGITDNDPLIVVDGVILAREVGNADNTGRTNFDADIDPTEIESIEVIKGAAAASMYGSRAAAGVISITTKRGRDTPLGQTRINYRAEVGKDYIIEEFPLAMHHFYRLSPDGQQFVDANGNRVNWSNRTADPNRRIADQAFPGTLYDNANALFRPNQFAQQNISLAQNNANTSFQLSLSRMDQNGALAGNDGYWRNQGRINLDHRLGDKFSVALSGLHLRSWQDGIPGNPYLDGLTFPSFVNLSAKDENGRYLQQPDSSVTIENPLFVQQTRDNFAERARTQASGNVRWSMMNWLTFDAQISYDRADANNQSYTPKGVPTSLTQDEPSQGTLVLDNERNDAYNGSAGATALRQFGNLAARATVRASFENEKNQTLAAEGRDFVVDGVKRLDAAADVRDIESFTTEIRTNGFLLNVGADYNDRYVVDGLIRRDGSSLFGPQERWHTYYRGAVSYRISREDWFKIPHVNELVLRYSRGTAGGRPSFNQQYQLWNVSRTGISRNTAGNAQLRPLHTTEQEFGINSVLFNSRMSLELVYARQISKDQIIGLPSPLITGYNTVYGNAGGLKGQVYEATLNARVLNRGDVSLNISAVADHSENEITNWGRACFQGHTINNELSNHEFSCDGEHRGDFWGGRLLHDLSQLPSWLTARASEFQVNDEGFLVWVGAGNDYTEGLSKRLWGTQTIVNGITYRWGEPILDVQPNGAMTYHKLGTSLPDVNFGITPDFRYKNVSLFAELRGQLGGNVYNMARRTLYQQARHKDVDQTGRPDELKKSVDYYSRGLSAGVAGFNEVFLEDGTYLKIGSLAVRYRVPTTMLERVFAGAAPKGLTIGAIARNLYTFTGYSGLDPESGRTLSRVETLGYPNLRTLTMTVDITF